jgi:mono/diheme cytochrome c family protein
MSVAILATAFNRVSASIQFALAVGLIIATAGPSIAQSDRSLAAPTFTKDVAPILFNHCASCHRSGGSAPFSLLTYADVRQRTTLIAAVTKNRLMPPWKAEPGYGGDFIGQHPLTDEQIDVIQRWVGEGSVEGNPRDLPRRPRWTEGWQLGSPDQVVTLAEPYIMKPDSGDVLRIFVIPIPLANSPVCEGTGISSRRPQGRAPREHSDRSHQEVARTR